MKLHEYLRMAQKSWVVILVAMLVGAAAGLGYSLVATPQYQSTTQLFVSVRAQDADTGDLLQEGVLAHQIVSSYVNVVTSALVLQPVIDELGLHTTVPELADRIDASSPDDSVVIVVTATDGSADGAAAIVDAVAASFTHAVQATLKQLAGATGQSPVEVTVLQPGIVPRAPVQPKPLLNTALGAMAGLLVGVVLAILRRELDTKVRTAEDVGRLVDAPLVGTIPLDAAVKTDPILMRAQPRGAAAEALRSLRTNLRFLDLRGGSRLFVLSSAGAGEGKSTTAVNLAVALAEAGVRVALVDADLRRPHVAAYLGLEGGVGLSDALVGRVPLADALQRWGRTKVTVLPAGRVPPNPAELLASAAMDRVLAELAARHEYVLVDAPPLTQVTDAAVLSKKTRGVIMIVAAGRTRKPQLAEAAKRLQTAGGMAVATVLTMVPARETSAYGDHGAVYGAPPAPARTRTR